MIKSSAFTVVANGGLLREIITDIQISEVISADQPRPTNKVDPRLHNAKSLWDTGATGCAITKKIADEVGLKPISKTLVTHADGQTLKNVYLLDIYLPNGIIIQGVQVTECESTAGKFDVLIGMSVITLGDFSITNHNGNTVMSFRMPSLHVLDYVKHTNGYPAQPFVAPPKIGRNDPCPNHPQNKYKNCCGKGIV